MSTHPPRVYFDDFQFEIPVSFFEKGDYGPDKRRRIGGIISTETPDRQGEVVLQRGLDFNYFVENGWFNNNHSKDMADILGYPDKVQRFAKGEKLPDGTTAKTNGTWAEGYLVETPEAERVWRLGKALQKTNRRLGFSIEGKIERRAGPAKKVIASAKVRNVAITHCPVNGDSRLEVLAKSLTAIETGEYDQLEKMLTVGAATPGVAPVGARTGDGAASLLSPESLESDERDLKKERAEAERQAKRALKNGVQKSLSQAEAIAWVRARLPGVGRGVAERIVNATRALKALGRL